MELLAIPLVGLGGLYLVSRDEQRRKQQRKRLGTAEGFSGSSTTKGTTGTGGPLPNVNLADRNYLEDGNTQDYDDSQGVPGQDLTKHLTLDHRYTGGAAFTDKYFQPQPVLGNSNTNSNSGVYRSLTGANVDLQYFQHNNMQPFFGSKSHETGPSRATESYMDSHTGAGSLHIQKQSQAPLFHPSENLQLPYGMQNMSDFVQDRMTGTIGRKQHNVQPFETQRVAPGGQDLLMARDSYGERTVDQLRAANKPKAGGIGLYGYEGPARNLVQEMATPGIQEMHKVPTSFEMGQDRWFTTVGQEKAQTARAEIIQRDVSRPETTRAYMGNAAFDGPGGEVLPGEYMPSTRQQLDAEPLRPAYVPGQQSSYDADYGKISQSRGLLGNNRTTGNNYGESYFGAIGSALGAGISSLMDVLRPTRKENVVGNLRVYQNAKSSVEGTYIFDPFTNRPSTTMRDLTGDSKYHWNVDGMANSDGYLTTPVTVNPTYRETQDPYSSRVGNAAAVNVKSNPSYEAEYRRTISDQKESVLHPQMNAGNMALFQGEIHMRSNARQEQMLLNTRPVDGGVRYVETPDVMTMGIQQGNSHPGLYAGQMVDRISQPELLGQLQNNPYNHSILGGI